MELDLNMELGNYGGVFIAMTRSRGTTIISLSISKGGCSNDASNWRNGPNCIY